MSSTHSLNMKFIKQKKNFTYTSWMRTTAVIVIKDDFLDIWWIFHKLNWTQIFPIFPLLTMFDVADLGLFISFSSLFWVFFLIFYIFFSSAELCYWILNMFMQHSKRVRSRTEREWEWQKIWFCCQQKWILMVKKVEKMKQKYWKREKEEKKENREFLNIRNIQENFEIITIFVYNYFLFQSIILKCSV